MIKVDKIRVYNIENAILGMRNPMNSWHKSDSIKIVCPDYQPLRSCKNCEGLLICQNFVSKGILSEIIIIGPNDMQLALKLIKNGNEHRKFLRQIFISMNITAPLYWWKEMDTYKIGTTANSTSTMHTLHKRKLTVEDFSFDDKENEMVLKLVEYLNSLIEEFNIKKQQRQEDEAKKVWRTLIQLLPCSFNQMRTWTANYEVLRNIYHQRKNHKLQEWRDFCSVLETLPYAEFITV